MRTAVYLVMRISKYNAGDESNRAPEVVNIEDNLAGIPLFLSEEDAQDFRMTLPEYMPFEHRVVKASLEIGDYPGFDPRLVQKLLDVCARMGPRRGVDVYEIQYAAAMVERKTPGKRGWFWSDDLQTKKIWGTLRELIRNAETGRLCFVSTSGGGYQYFEEDSRPPEHQ